MVGRSRPAPGLRSALRRPVLIISANPYNQSNLRTVTVAVLTTNLKLAALPGNVSIPADIAGSNAGSVVDVTQIATIDRAAVDERIGTLPDWLTAQVDAGLMRALGRGVPSAGCLRGAG
ncbi:MAG: mRNA interferase MazF [Solirubrobacteraceae bacterium]|nr:mRNA interferase MazF [Solirubrobacteraceae bacterium]